MKFPYRTVECHETYYRETEGREDKIIIDAESIAKTRTIFKVVWRWSKTAACTWSIKFNSVVNCACIARGVEIGTCLVWWETWIDSSIIRGIEGDWLLRWRF